MSITMPVKRTTPRSNKHVTFANKRKVREYYDIPGPELKGELYYSPEHAAKNREAVKREKVISKALDKKLAKINSEKHVHFTDEEEDDKEDIITVPSWYKRTFRDSGEGGSKKRKVKTVRKTRKNKRNKKQ